MSFGGDEQQTVNSGPPAWLQNYVQGYLGSASQAAQMPYQQYQGPRVAPIDPMQWGALNGMQGRMYGSPATNMAEQYFGNTISGGSVNPFMNEVIGNTRRNVTDAYNQATTGTTALFNRPGSFTSTAHAQAQDTNQQNLARGLSETEGQLRMQGFEQDQARRMQAAQGANQFQNSAMQNLLMALQAGDIPRRYGQQLIDSQYGDFQEAQNYPWSQLDRFGNALSRAYGGAGSTQTMTMPGADPIASGLGTLAFAQYLGK